MEEELVHVGAARNTGWAVSFRAENEFNVLKIKLLR